MACDRSSTVLRIRGLRAGYAKAKAMMTSLLTVKSPRVFYKLCGNIARKWPRLSDWVRHKKQRFIISGLTHACSPLSDEDWHTIGSNTNGVESQHQKAYTEGGQFVSLIEAVKSGQYIDGNSSAKFYNYTKTGKRDRYRNTTAEGREDLSQKRYGPFRPNLLRLWHRHQLVFVLVGELHQHRHLEYPVLVPLRPQFDLASGQKL
ncbi:hypothetical protein E4U31_001402 [Claviceps sp. LM219 group G6]|nr:hypothetical protein E4U31_001402 [Claviceps sp. LM219 group G6]